MSTSDTGQRRARIEFWQLPNGYWHAEVEVKTATASWTFHTAGDLFHDAGECMEWARMQLELVVARA